MVVRDFVMSDVLGNERPDLREHHVGVGDVGRANGRLAEALTGRPDALDLLACGRATRTVHAPRDRGRLVRDAPADARRTARRTAQPLA